MSYLFEQGPELANHEFFLLAALLREHCGLDFGLGNKYVIERRLRPRLDELGLTAFSEYLTSLQLHGPELDVAVDLLVTNETYFFRERYQLDAFEAELLPELAERNKASRRLSIWSAGCSTGEEAYSVAMIIQDSGLFDGWDVRVCGSDISRPALQHARVAVYKQSAFRTMQPRFEHHFVDHPDGRLLSQKVRSICRFARINLAQHDQSAIVGPVDVVFCRNVLIYFADDVRQRVVETMYQRLAPGGYLMLGHSESLFRGASKFELVHLETDLVYRRPAPFEDPR